MTLRWEEHTAENASSMRGVWCISDICSLVQSLRGAVALRAFWKTDVLSAAVGGVGG